MVNKIVVIAGGCKRDGFIPGFFDGFQHVTLAHMPDILKEAYLKVAPDKSRLQTMFEKDVARMKSFKDWSDDSLRSIKAPALFMVAQHDVMTVAHTIEMSQLVKDAQLAVLPGIHGAFIGAMESGIAENSKLPGITAALVEEFLGG